MLPGANGCLVLITSRNQLSALVATDGAHPLILDLLSSADAYQLLAHRLHPDRIAADPDAGEEIIGQCARLPLALAIVAARAATHPHQPLGTFARELRDASRRLDALGTDDPATNVRTVFSWSYQALPPDAARLFRHLGLHPGPDLSAAAAASATALPLVQVQPLLAQLAGANLVIDHSPGRYSLHDLLRAYAADLAYTSDADQQRHTITRRILDHDLHTAYSADRLLHPTREPIILTPPQAGVRPEHLTDHEQALAWFTAEHAVLLAAVDHAATTGFDAHAWQLAWAVTTFLHRRGHWHDWAAVGRIAVAASERLADRSAQARAHRQLAGAHTRLGHFDDAHIHLQHALALDTQTGDLAGQAHTDWNLSMLSERQAHHSRALEYAQQALRLYRAAGHRQGQADALNAIGWQHAQLGDHQQALTACQLALTLLQELDDRYGQANTWDSLGYARQRLGQHTQAATCYQHAIDLFRGLGDRYWEATTLTRLGDTHQSTGNHQAARDTWRHALTILDQLHHPDAAQVRGKLVVIGPRGNDNPS